MTLSGRYRKMNRITSETVDSWIAQEELPVSPNIKVVRTNDPDYGLTEDEIQDRNEYIRCYLLQEHELLMMMPKQDTEDDFFIVDCGVDDPEYSAFNTHDFQITQRPFNKYHYAMKKIMERVKELAINHSSITSEERRMDEYRRYENLVWREFRRRLGYLANKYARIDDEEERSSLKSKIAELNRRIMECKRIWERYAPPQNWDL
jgi:hypothetical protein